MATRHDITGRNARSIVRRGGKTIWPFASIHGLTKRAVLRRRQPNSSNEQTKAVGTISKHANPSGVCVRPETPIFRSSHRCCCLQARGQAGSESLSHVPFPKMPNLRRYWTTGRRPAICSRLCIPAPERHWPGVMVRWRTWGRASHWRAHTIDGSAFAGRRSGSAFCLASHQPRCAMDGRGESRFRMQEGYFGRGKNKR